MCTPNLLGKPSIYGIVKGGAKQGRWPKTLPDSLVFPGGSSGFPRYLKPLLAPDSIESRVTIMKPMFEAVRIEKFKVGAPTFKDGPLFCMWYITSIQEFEIWVLTEGALSESQTLTLVQDQLSTEAFALPGLSPPCSRIGPVAATT